jgi:hypothetical protein
MNAIPNDDEDETNTAGDPNGVAMAIHMPTFTSPYVWFVQI